MSNNNDQPIQSPLSPKDSLRIDAPIGEKRHADSDLHLIDESLPAPSLVAAFTSVGAVGQSPNVAREDHRHPLADGTVSAPSLGWGNMGFYRFSGSAVGLSIAGVAQHQWDANRFFAPNISIGRWGPSPSFGSVEGPRGYLLLGAPTDPSVYLRADTGNVNLGAGGADRVTVAPTAVTITPAISCNAINSGAISCTTINTNANTITAGPINSGTVTAPRLISNEAGAFHMGSWSSWGVYMALESPHGYVLLGANAPLNGSLFLHTKAAWPVQIGQNGTNTLTVGNNSTTANGTFTATGSVQTPTVSSITGDLNIDASGSIIRLNDWVIPLNPPGAASGATMIFNASNVISFFTSCRELKDKIVSFSDSGSIIDQLNPVTFIEKSKDPENEHPDLTKWREAHIIHGFIAEEVAEVEPRLASWQFDEDENLKPIAWDQFSMISVLVAELKNLRARVLELESANV